jgi:asparagine N-glycosylation enzyme membrane subunit Stt3
MPGIFGSLVVIPLVLIGRVLGNVWVGFLQGETDEKVVKF